MITIIRFILLKSRKNRELYNKLMEIKASKTKMDKTMNQLTQRVELETGQIL